MPDFTAQLHELEVRTESALGALEQNDRWAEALEIYCSAGTEVDALRVPRPDPAYKPARQLRAYLYLREANALRALGRQAEAAPLGDLELSAAMASGNRLSIARAMFSLGSTCVANGEIERGLKLLDDARPMSEHNADPAHRQGLGWWYLIQADIGNTGLVRTAPEYALQASERALSFLRPLENWPGIARAHAARARAYERLGNAAAARVAHAAEQMAQEVLRLKAASAPSAPRRSK
jgi:tetratricopeptide (TPR) repeat protein